MTRLNSEEIEVALKLLGLSIPQSTLRSWREDGLVPAAERGGLSRYSDETIEQIIAVHRLYKRKRSKNFVGWNLWLEGFEVPEEYWRPHFEGAARTSFRRLRWIARSIQRRGEEAKDAIHSTESASAVQHNMPSPINSITRGMDNSILVERLALIAEAISGTHEEDDSKVLENQVESLASFSGMSQKNRTSIMENQIEIDSALRNFINALSTASENNIDASLFSGQRLVELKAVRDCFRDAMEVGSNLSGAFQHIYGDNAFGLRLAHYFRYKAPPPLQASLISLAMALFKKEPDAFLGLEQIQEMKAVSQDLKAYTDQIEKLRKDHPSFNQLLSPKSLRNGLKSDVTFSEFMHKIRQVRDNLLV